MLNNNQSKSLQQTIAFVGSQFKIKEGFFPVRNFDQSSIEDLKICATDGVVTSDQAMYPWSKKSIASVLYLEK